MKVALVCPPFWGPWRPPLGLSLLRSALTDKGIACDIFHLNVDYASRIGMKTHSLLADYDPTDMLGEWIFSQFVLSPVDEAGLRDFARYIASRPRGVSDGWRTEDNLTAMLRKGIACAQEALSDWMQLPWQEYDVVGFSSTFQQNMASFALARRLKERFNSYIVMGGANCHGPMGPAVLRHFPCIDAVSTGEGENAFPAFVTKLMAGERLDVPGMVTRETRIPQRPEPVDIGTAPLPHFDDWVQIMEQKMPEELRNCWWSYEASRGCWWGELSHCKFCGMNSQSMAFRSKPPGRVLDDFKALTKYRHISQRLMFVDNILDMAYFRSLLPQLSEANLGFSLFSETKSNLTRDKVALLRRSGFTSIQPGIESLSTNVLRLMGKGVTSLQNVQLLKWCKEYKVAPLWNILYGFVGEKPEDFRDQIQLIQRIRHLPPPVSINRVRMDRFSPYFEHSTQEGIQLGDPLPTYRFVYRGMDVRAIQDMLYYFEYTHRTLEMSEQESAPLREAVREWIEVYPELDLFMDDRNERWIVYRVEGDDAWAEEATPLGSWLLQHTDSNRTIGSLVALAEEEGWRESDTREALDQMLDKGWLVREGDRVLSVVLSLKTYRPRLRRKSEYRARIQS